MLPLFLFLYPSFILELVPGCLSLYLLVVGVVTCRSYILWTVVGFVNCFQRLINFSSTFFNVLDINGEQQQYIFEINTLS